MKLTRTSILSAASLLIGGLLGASALVAMAQTNNWSGPSTTPPGGNVAAPINVGDVFQNKTGKFSLGALLNYSNESNRPLLDVNGTGMFTNLGVAGNLLVSAGASTTAGSVLTNDGTGIASWTTKMGGSVANLYGITWGTNVHNTNSTWTDTGLSLNVTPASATSRYLINANIDADNGNDPGACTVGLFQDSTLLVQFGVIGDPNDAVMPLSVSYVANAGNTNPRTYLVKVINDCYLNYPQSNASGANSATSTMTILEVN